MKITDAYSIVDEAIEAKVPVMLWGQPGIGKSSIVKQIAEKKGLDLIDLRLPQLEPTDLRGIPMPDRDAGVAKWYPPAFLPNKKNSNGILFLDELEKAPVSVKNAALQLVLDRRLGDYVLPDGWAIVAAGNREDDGCFSTPLGSALCNRLMHLEIEPDLDAWISWAKENGISDDFLGFLQFRPDLLYHYTQGENAFPSPRTWAMASKMLEQVKQVEMQNKVLTGIIGKNASQEYRTWVKVYKTVNVEDIIVKGADPGFKNNKDKSYQYAVAMAVAHYVKKRGPKDIEENVAKFLMLMPAEMQVIFSKQLTVQILGKLAQHKSFKPISSRIMEIANRV